VYEWTRPCLLAECLHERDPDTCEAMQTPKPSACPSSRSPHGIRRGALTRMLREGVPEGVVSDRSDVSATFWKRTTIVEPSVSGWKSADSSSEAHDQPTLTTTAP
jgi:hypothetical protein